MRKRMGTHSIPSPLLAGYGALWPASTTPPNPPSRHNAGYTEPGEIQRARPASRTERVHFDEGEGFDSVLSQNGTRQVDPHRLSRNQRGAGRHLPRDSQSRRTQGGTLVLDLKYSLVIEATSDANFFGFYSPTLEGFTGAGHSIEDCIYKARRGMKEHVNLLREKGFPVPPPDSNPSVLIRNKSAIPATA